MPVETTEVDLPKKPKKPQVLFQLPDKTPVSYKTVSKFHRDVIRHCNGAEPIISEKKRAAQKEMVTVSSLENPLGENELHPGKQSPICVACGLDQEGCYSPYLEYVGSENPVATILVEAIGRKEDERGSIGSGGTNAWIAGLIHQLSAEHGVALEDIRWVPITRCASRGDKRPNYKTKGNWCRYYAIQDLMLHPPKVVIPVGTAALGLLCHKSNAGDWSGRLLTWRGWPDDWLTDKNFMLDRVDPTNPEKTVRGHPLFGPAPHVRIPMVPVQNPNLVLRDRNELVIDRWKEDLIYALETGKNGIVPQNYDRPWYRMSENPDEVIAALEEVIALAEAFENLIVAFDTETDGLKQWAYVKRLRATLSMGSGLSEFGAAIKANDEDEDEILRSPDPRIVFMMFRWTHPITGERQSIGFPWDYPESEIKPHMERIAPLVIRLMALCSQVGHNLTFDDLFVIATVNRKEGEHVPFSPDGNWNENWLALQDRINLISEAAHWDTWHMVFTALQKRGSLGLELLAYDWVPDLAGYEEDMTLLIELHGDLMHPANGKGGHYANCPKDKWNTHLKPYVMGDVEVTYQTRERVAAKLEKSKVYRIPIAKPNSPGSFRYYQTPRRDWVYKNIVSPASRTLTKMMARGMHIDQAELTEQERVYPAKVHAAKERLREADPLIERWCQTKTDETAKANAANPEGGVGWELDLENKGQLKELLFDVLKCPIHRLTKKGRQLYGEDPSEWEGVSYQERKEYAAVDKFTLNRLTVDYPNLRPLQEYRKTFKVYSTYVRPMRNMMSDGLDKKQREKVPHLSVDGCIHAQFLLTGTRSGRLSSRDPNLQNLPNEALVKRFFTSRFRERGCIYTADLSQIELRLMAAACGDPSMVQAYLDDIDIHSLTASKIVWQDGKRIPYEHFTKKHMEELQKANKSDVAKMLELRRKIAKTTNFLTGYGGGAFGLQNVLANNEVYMALEDCEDIVYGFFEAYPVLKRFLGIYKTFIEENGVAVSLFGRVRYFEEVYSEDREASSKALRAGCNHLIQSTASDMMLICLFTIETLMRQAGLNSLLNSTVHDSLVIDAVREELPEVHAIVSGVMNNIPLVIEQNLPEYDTSWMSVPFAGDSEVGLNYLETNKISGDNPDWDALLQPKKKD